MVTQLVTVVIVNYNSGLMLTRCVTSLLASTVSVNILISDNASTDNSLSLLTQQFPVHPSIFIQRNSKNLGFSAGNNVVFPLVVTPFILYLNPDCFVEQNTLEHMLAVMNNNPQAGVVGCIVKNLNGSEQAGCRGLTPTPLRILCQSFKLNKLFPHYSACSGYLLSEQPLPQHPIAVELISGSCMLVRKTAIDEIGLLDEAYFLYCEDYDWFYRFLQHKWQIIFTPNTAVTHIKAYSAKKIPLRVLWYKTKGMWRYHDKFFRNNASFLSYTFIKLGIILRFCYLYSVELLKKCLGKREPLS